MNNNIDLTKILKDCPKGWKLYTPIFGEVEFSSIEKDCTYPIILSVQEGGSATFTGLVKFTKEGCFFTESTDVECLLFPSKEQRDWSKFTAPWYKKEMDTIALLKKQGKQEEPQVYETKDGKIVTYSETDGYKFVEPNFHKNAWLYLVSDVLTWKDGIGQYLDDPRVQELAKKLCSEYSQKLYNPSVLSNLSNTGKNEQKSDNKIESKFHKGDWITIDKPCQIINIHDNGNYIVQYCDDEKTHELSKNFCESYFHFWTIQDAKDGDIIHLGTVTAIFKKYIGQEKCICYCSFCKDGGFEIPVENGEDNVYGCYNATPSTKEQRDSFIKVMNDDGYEWDIEKKELNKKKKFDPKTLKPFDKVLVRDKSCYNWMCELFSYIKTESEFKYWCISNGYKYCIPYNDDTKHLVGTSDEAPESYRYWED